jgi:hypothetical protein
MPVATLASGHGIGTQNTVRLDIPADDGVRPTPEAAAKLLHFVLFVAYLRTVLRDAIKLRFASPRQMRSRWLTLKLIAGSAHQGEFACGVAVVRRYFAEGFNSAAAR